MDKKQILFVKPGESNKNQVWAIHHFADAVSRQDGFNVCFATSNHLVDPGSKISLFPVYPGLKKGLGAPLAYLVRLIRFAGVLKKVKPDILFINNHIGAIDCVLMACFLRLKTRYILDIRTLPDQKWKYLYYRRITPFFHFVFGLNPDILVKMVNTKNKAILPLGYDPGMFYPDPRPRPGFEPGSLFKCLYFGSLDKKRRIIDLIRGVEKAAGAGCRIRLTIIGEGNGKKQINAYVQNHHLEQQIVVRGFVPQEKLRQIIVDHHVGISFVPNTGMYGPQVPLKTIEILACGIPVLATDTRGNKCVVRHGWNGYIAPDSPQGIADLFSAVCAGGLDAKLYQNAARSVAHMTWQKIVVNHLLPVLNKAAWKN